MQLLFLLLPSKRDNFAFPLQPGGFCLPASLAPSPRTRRAAPNPARPCSARPCPGCGHGQQQRLKAPGAAGGTGSTRSQVVSTDLTCSTKGRALRLAGGIQEPGPADLALPTACADAFWEAQSGQSPRHVAAPRQPGARCTRTAERGSRGARNEYPRSAPKASVHPAVSALGGRRILGKHVLMAQTLASAGPGLASARG